LARTVADPELLAHEFEAIIAANYPASPDRPEPAPPQDARPQRHLAPPLAADPARRQPRQPPDLRTPRPITINPTACQPKTVCVPLVTINGPSYRLKDRLNLVTRGDAVA
jgi:hypothetical protein